jgi:hypothetical protein
VKKIFVSGVFCRSTAYRFRRRSPPPGLLSQRTQGAGGGQEKAVATYQKGLDAIREHKGSTNVPLEPTLGEPELLTSLAWSNLNRTTPDLKAAEQYAQSALKLVPYWHYVRDILMPQIHTAQAKAR